MGLLSSLKKYAVKLERMNGSIFECPVSKQRDIINSFRQPVDDFERSFYQYKCQMKLNKPVISIVMNLASLPLVAYFFVKKWNTPYKFEKSDAIFIAEDIPDHVIPDELRDEYETWIITNDHGMILTKADRRFIKKIFMRFPFSWHLLLKCIIKIGYYRYEIERHNPSVIVVCGEYSFTSSILTAYCHEMGIKHYDVMHGEKVYYMRDTFFHFDRCYVWDEFYKKLFIQLRAEKNQFIVSTPGSMRFSDNLKVEKTVDYTYYLGGEDEHALKRVSKALNILKNRGYAVAIRPHPRYSDMDLVKRLFNNIEIEDFKDIDIERSILRTGNVVALYSTVLNQAYHNNVAVVIDDISNSERYRKLKLTKYIMLNVDHRLLSEVLREKREDGR